MPKMQELFEKVSGDGALQEKFVQIMKDAEAAGKEETEAKLTAFAKEAGYGVNVEEMKDFFKGLAETHQNELSNAELDMVAGGKNLATISLSIFTLGIGCAVVSADAKKYNMSCDEYTATVFGQKL